MTSMNSRITQINNALVGLAPQEIAHCIYDLVTPEILMALLNAQDSEVKMSIITASLDSDDVAQVKDVFGTKEV